MAKVRTNPALEGVSGALGNLVFVQTADGTVLRGRPTPNDPKTPAQRRQRNALSGASQLYQTLTPAQLDAWRAYVRTLPQYNPATNRPNAFNVFSGLASKFLQMNPHGTPPLNAPAAPFFGDVVTLHVAGETGRIVFTVDAPNAARVRTELLLQTLANAARVPIRERYRSKAFVTFAAGSLSAEIVVEPGAYAPAYRFVHAETGQETPFVPLPTVVVS